MGIHHCKVTIMVFTSATTTSTTQLIVTPTPTIDSRPGWQRWGYTSLKNCIKNGGVLPTDGHTHTYTSGVCQNCKNYYDSVIEGEENYFRNKDYYDAGGTYRP